MQFPQTKEENVIDKINGFLISDPYRWLEDKNKQEVINWIDMQNGYTESVLKNCEQKIFLEELTKYFEISRHSIPKFAKNHYFYFKKHQDEDQPVLYYQYGINGTSIMLINVNNLTEGNQTSIDFFYPGWSGKYIVYGLSKSGTEMSTLYVKNVVSKEEMSDTINNCRRPAVCWTPDDSGFFYTRNPSPGKVPENEEHLHSKVYFHKLGDNPKNDKLIFGKDLPKETEFRLSISIDGKYLAIHATKLGVYILDIKNETIVHITKGKNAYYSLMLLKDKALLYTDYKADNFRILFTTLDKLFNDIDSWDVFYPEQNNLLQSVSITSDKILLQYLVNVSSEIITVDHDGNVSGNVPLPKYSSVEGFSTNIKEKEYFYSINSFTDPQIIYRYDPDKSIDVEYQRTYNPIDPKNYTVKQLWYKSKDGTSVPLFVIHKNNVVPDGKNPTILEGYGGFGANQVPHFPRNYVPWIERGGVYALANIRGGREFGKKWHINGIGSNKQNSFDDFICASENLISKDYTDTEHLGIIGQSNGGLLVSTVAVQRPDLFKAVCSRVAIYDMVRYVKFGLGPLWVNEYGDPNIKEDLERILKWSPYHNVKEDVEYPNFLFLTADNDTRADPLHSRKMTALLQSVNKKNKVLLYTDFGSGHFQGKPVSKIVDQQSLVLSFFAEELGLRI